MSPLEMSRPKPRAYSYVRFSRPEQMRTDSLRRQTELSERYAKEHGLELDTTLDLADLGKSAFRGKNATEGKLAGFIAAIEAGQIKRGSYLLVESLDRLSRQEVVTALQRFLAILEKGIKIVTLQDQQIYSTEALNGNFAPLLISLSIMFRAHEESATKGKRVSAAWENKLANIGTKKLTKLCPGWLKLSEDRSRYEPIPERVEIINRIFESTINGKGRRTIANELNTERVTPWGIGKKRGDGWQDSYIAKVLASRAVLGEYVPHRMINGVRTPTDQVIKDYFPAIIPEKTFYLAQASLTKRAGRGGRVTITDANLFAGLCVCGQCGGSVTYTDKGDPAWRYLRCTRTARKLSNCEPHSTLYAPIERDFIQWIVNFDFTGGQQSAKRKKQAELSAVERQCDETQRQLDRLNEALTASDKPVRSFIPRIQKAEADIELFTKSAAILRAEIERAEESVKNANFHELAKNRDNRFRLREEIRRRVEKITVHFKAPEDWPDADPFFSVKLKDGSVYAIKDAETVQYWTKDGRRYTSEPGLSVTRRRK